VPLGLYVSRCSGRVDDVVDIDRALEDARRQAAVVRVFDDLFDAQVQDRMVKDVADAELDSVVLAGHSADHYARSLSGKQLQQRLVDAGVNPNRIVAANLLEQCVAVHGDDPKGATRKAKAMIDIACLRATVSEAVEGIEAQPRRAVLVLGASMEGMVAAQRLLQLGYSVVIADRGSGIAELLESPTMRATVAYVSGHPSSEFVDHARLVDGSGWLGDYAVTLNAPGGDVTYRAGGILIALTRDTDWIAELRQHFKVDIDDEGRARSLEPATHPAETVDPGIMVVPLREESDSVADKVSAADAAAMALVLKLSQPRTVHYVEVSQVDETLCGGCGSCVKTCAFGACSIDENGLSHVDVRRCRGCGKCVVSCPVGARDIVNSPHDYLMEAIRTLAEVDTDSQEKVLGFLCSGCGYPAADRASAVAAENGGTYPASFLPVQIPCGGRLDTLYVLEAFRSGFDGVAVFRCREGHCHNLIGNLDMDRRVNLLRTVLRSRNLDDSRLRIIDISPSEGQRFIDQVNDVYESIGSLGTRKGGL